MKTCVFYCLSECDFCLANNHGWNLDLCIIISGFLPLKLNVEEHNKPCRMLLYIYIYIVVSAFRDRGVPKPTSECRRVPQPRWVERVGEREGGKWGGRRWAWERWKSRGLRVRPAPRSGALAVGGYKRPCRRGKRAAPRERLSRPRPRAANPL
jgi:hypothetical protein